MFGVPLHSVKEEWQKKISFLLIWELLSDFHSAKLMTALIC
jgi:hypothetical protein